MSRLGRTRTGFVAAAVAAALLVPSSARSDTVVVTTCDGVQPALNAAADGDVIRLNIATLCAIDSSVVLPSNLTITLEGAPGVTTGFTPDTGFDGPLVRGTDVLGTTLRNLTLTGVSSAVSGNALRIDGLSAPLLDELIIQNNTSTAANRSPVVIENTGPVTAVRSSAADDPVAAGGPLPLLIEDLLLGGAAPDLGNEGDIGGALHLFLTDTDVIIRNTIVQNNVATEAGGGIAISGTGAVSATGLSVRDNQAMVRGGGIDFAGTDGSQSSLRGLFIGNDVAGPGVVSGGGLFASLQSGAGLDITRSTFSGNTAMSTNGNQTRGGAIGIESNQGGDLYVRDTTIFMNDVVTAGLGGGMSYALTNGAPDSELNVVNSVIAENSIGTVGVGGGIVGFCVTNCPGWATFLNNTVYGNNVGDGDGQQMGFADLEVGVNNSIVRGDVSSPPFDDLFGVEPGTQLNVNFSAVCAPDGGAFPGMGNRCVRPLFRDAGAGNFHLLPGPGVDQASSALLDLGSVWSAARRPLGTATRLARDFEGDARVIDANADGSARPDMGADEMIGRSRITIGIAKTARKVLIDGRVIPRQGGSVTVTVYEKVGGKFQKVGRKKDALGSGRYEAAFSRPDGDTCKVRSRFGGSATNRPVAGSKTFSC